MNPAPEEDLAQAGGSAHPAAMKDGGQAPFRAGAKAAWQAAKRALKPRFHLYCTLLNALLLTWGGNGKRTVALIC